jgi:ankyrin repeat protein
MPTRSSRKARGSTPAPSLDSILVKASRQPDEWVPIYLQQGGNPNARCKMPGADPGEYTNMPLLHCSILYGGADAVGTKALCAAGADLDINCEYAGDTRDALIWSANNARWLEHMKAVMDGGADMTRSSRCSYTAFGVAAEKNNVHAIREFLARGVSPDLKAVPTGHTPAIKAAETGKLPVLILLQKAGADLNLTENYGQAALHLAAKNNHWPVVSYLLQTGDVHIDAESALGQTALYQAAEEGHAKVVQLLLKAGADPYAADNQGLTPFINAVKSAHMECMALLHAADCDINVVQKDGLTPLGAG